MRISLIDTDNHWAWGIRMISSVLKRKGHRTRIVLMNTAAQHYSHGELAEVAELVRDSDLVGVSCHSVGSDRARDILAHLKPLGLPRIWGGIHATLNPEECTQAADIVCIGEGEKMMVELAARLEAGQDWRDLRNVAYRQANGIVQNPLHPLIGQMDELPLLDFSCDDEFTLVKQHLVRRTGTADFAKEGIPFLGSRGCVFRCTYCCNRKLREIYAGTGNYVRKHSMEQCIERPAALRQSFPGGKYIFFVDDDFLDRTPAELRKFADEFPRRVGLPFECQVSPLRVTQEKIELLAKAGVWRIRMGVESGSERTRKEVYDRPMPDAAVERASEILSRFPDVVRAYYFIIGNPFEERDDLLATIALIRRLPPPYFIQPFNLVFFPGSSLYERALAAGLISGKQDSGYDLHYRGGLKYEKHPWKRKNLYLNTLLFLMEGKVTRRRIGILPRFLLPWLTTTDLVGANERHPAFAKAMIELKILMLKTRTAIGSAIKRVFPHPEAIYNPVAFLRARMPQAFGRPSLPRT